MFKYLKAKQHKAISNLNISNLGKINVLCGRNNSGKTSVFEALSDEAHFAIGKPIINANHMTNLFASQAQRYSNPSPKASKKWFHTEMTKLIETETVWYSDEYASVKENLIESMIGTPLARHDRNSLFNFDPMLDAFFEIESYRPLLIPPKRKLDAIVPLNFNQEMDVTGEGILNRLFFLKNQDIQSSEYSRYSEIYKLFYDVTDLYFNVFPDNQNNLTLFYGKDGDWREANDCGLGLTDVLIMISLVVDTNSNFILIEEPENHLHANYQKRLLNILRSTKEQQFFLSTHSSVFLDVLAVDRIFHVRNTSEVEIDDQTSKSKMISDLGYSVAENLVSDAIILTEGPSDIEVIREILSKVGTLDDFNIRFWLLGGDNMQHLDVGVFAETTNVFAIVDNDPGSSKARTRFLRNCKKHEIPCIRLEKYSIENYATLSALRSVFPRQIPSSLKNLEPTKKVDVQIGFSNKNKSIKPKLGKVFTKMDLSDLAGTDLLDFLKLIDFTLKNQIVG